MSNAFKLGKSGLIYGTDLEKAKNFCTSNYGPEWELDVRQVNIFETPFYQGRCVHRRYTGNIQQCCNGYLIGENIFGSEGALTTSKTTCSPDLKNVLTCNQTNLKDVCYNQAMSGTMDKYCSSFIRISGNNLELIKNELINKFIEDYVGNNGKYSKYKNFMDSFGKLSMVSSLHKIVQDAYDIEVIKSDLNKLTAQFNQKVSDLNQKDIELNQRNILIKQKDDELSLKQRMLDDKIFEFNIKDKDLMNIRAALDAKQSEFDKIVGALGALEEQNKIMEASLVEKNALIANVNKNIQETEAKLKDYISQRDQLNKELNETKEKTDREIRLAQDNYRSQLESLQQQEREARAKLEEDLAAQKKKDMDELTKVMQNREAELEKNFAEIKASYDKAAADSKIETEKLMAELEAQKKQSEETIQNYNKQIQAKSDELNLIKKQKDDEIIQIQKQTSESIEKIKADNEKESAALIKKLEEEKEKSLQEITNVFNAREKEINDRLLQLQAQMAKAEQDNKLAIQAMMDDYEKKRTEYENTLLDEYKKKDEDYKKMSDKREKEYQDALTKLQLDNKKQTDQLNEQFVKEIALINEQKAQMQLQFDDFKKKSESDIALLTTKLNEEREIYNKEIERLNTLIKQKEEEAKQKLLEIQISLQNDMDALNATQELKKELLFEQTNKQINMALEDLESKKVGINKSFEEELKKKQTELDNSLQSQKEDYAKRLDSLQKSNDIMVAQLEETARKYQIAQEEQNLRLDNLLQIKQKEYEQIQKDYDTKSKVEQDKFAELIKKMENDKSETIKKFTQETEKELLKLNLVVEEQRLKNQVESDSKREELKVVINQLEDEKIRLVKEKNDETQKALNKIQELYDSQAAEINKKLEEYNKAKENYDKMIKDEMNIFENQMRALEEQKLNRINEFNKVNQEELLYIGKTIDVEKQKSIEDGIKYRKALEETIEQLDRERNEIIKKKNDETQEILGKIKQEYEIEASLVNQKIKEYNDKKNEYDKNIKIIDEEQTFYVAKKRAEAEQELSKLSKMLADEINDLKYKIESYKIQRDQKLKEINELNEKLRELQNMSKKSSGLFGFFMWSFFIIVVILLVALYLKRAKGIDLFFELKILAILLTEQLRVSFYKFINLFNRDDSSIES